MKAIAELTELFFTALWALCVALWEMFGFWLIPIVLIAIILSPLATSECKFPWESGYFSSKMKDDIDEMKKK